MASSKPQTEGSAALESPVVRRTLVLAAFLFLWMLVVALRLYDLQVIQYVRWLARGERQQQQVVEIAPQRGIIYDRNLHPLAMSLPAESIYAVPNQIPDPGMVVHLLAPILKLDPQDLLGQFKAYRSFCWIERKVSHEQAARVKALNLKGIYFEKEMKRFYPNGDLAAQVLGYVGMDNNGLAGLEYSFNSLMKGKSGRVLLETDARHHSFKSVEQPGQPGQNLVLTLDRGIQFIAERELAKIVKKYHAAGGVVIVQNPHTGDILAMASQPTFNPNDFEQAPAGATENRAVAWIYEPGSTFKLVTISAALQEGLASPDQVINCQEGQIVVAGIVTHDWHPFGDLTVAQVLMNSSEVGTIKIGLRLGEQRLYDWILRYGFDRRTDIGLASEERGLLEPPSRWSGISIADISTGQGVGITPLQLVDAYSAVANGGVMMKPRIVSATGDGSDLKPVPVSPGRRILSPQTDEEMKQMLEGVVTGGTGRPAQLDGYSAAGKTGTAQKIDSHGRYSHHHYIASFIGFAPVENPAVTILVAIDTPVGAIYGDQVAAPAFKFIAEQTLNYLSVPQDQPSQPLQVASLTHPAARRQQRLATSGNPPNNFESAEAATRPVSANAGVWSPGLSSVGTVILDDGPRVTVPDFAGQSARQVASECQALGFEAELSGLGVAVEQTPPAGAQVPLHTSVWVRLAR